MQLINCFEVLGHTNTTDGRGPMKVVARFSTYLAAVNFVQSKAYAQWCVMGHQDPVSDIKHIREFRFVIYVSPEELTQEYKETLKASAIAKLTKEERAALGI